jgi:uncharacterized protein YdiU (UPF0061 family)
MFALGVPTTRALAAVATGQQVVRETVLPGAIFTRVAASHLRVGTFQYFAARGDTDALRTLTHYALARHYPEAAHAPNPARALLDAVITHQASLIAQWMLLGFIHGVMNTDNTSISGESIDFGPCAFMEAYHPGQVYSSIDVQGRYAYSNQPHAAHWNLTRLAEALLPLLTEEYGTQEAALAAAYESLAAFGPQYEAAHLAGLRRKLGLFTRREGDAALAADLLERMVANRADFTRTFRLLCDAAASPAADTTLRALFADPTAYDAWATSWRHRLADESAEPASAPERAASMRLANPTFIPRNHLVEAAINAATQRNDFQPFEELLDVVTHPFDSSDDRPDRARYTTPARPEECVTATFCGT